MGDVCIHPSIRYKTLILPILVHGTYDLVLFMLATKTVYVVIGFIISVLIVVGTYLYIRRRILFLMKAFPHEVDVHQRLAQGDIHAPGCLCCTPSCCPCCY